jgi:hypothetical protein
MMFPKIKIPNEEFYQLPLQRLCKKVKTFAKKRISLQKSVK